LEEALEALKPTTEVIILERCWHSDRNTFAEMLRARGKMSPMEWSLYDQWYRFAVKNAPRIDGHIYLQCTTDTCMSRLRKRDRSEEVGVTDEYQSELIKRHEAWLSSVPAEQQLRINVDRDFVSDAERGKAVVAEISEFVAKLRTVRDAHVAELRQSPLLRLSPLFAPQPVFPVSEAAPAHPLR